MNYKKSLFIGLFSLILFSNLFALEIEYVTYEGFDLDEYKEVYVYFTSDIAELELDDIDFLLESLHPEYWNPTINLISLSTLADVDYSYMLTFSIQAIQEQVMDELELHLGIIDTEFEDSYKLKVVIDKSFTLLSEVQQRTMAENFLPVMLMDSGEEGGIPDYPEIYYPKEINVLLDALGNTATIRYNNNYITDATLENLAKYNSSNYKIHFFMDDDISGGNHVINTWYQDNFNEIEINYNTQLYASFIEDGNFVVLTYWFYSLYNNNDWDDLGIQTNHHISDWEGMSLIFNSTGFGVNSEPIYAATSSHMKSGTKKGWEETYKVNDHPVVFVCNGSHATYFVPGHSSNEGGFLQDFHYGKGAWVLPIGISENDVLAISDLQSYLEGYSGEIIHFGDGGSSSDQVEILERLNNIDTDQLENYWHSFGGLWGQSYLFGKIESYSPSGPPFIESNDDGTITDGYKWFHPYLWYEAQREDHTIIVDEDNVDLSIENGVLTGTITLQLLYNGSYINQTLYNTDFSVYALKNGSIDNLYIDNVSLNGTFYTLTIEDDYVDLDPGFYDIEIHYDDSGKFGVGYIKNIEVIIPLDGNDDPTTATVISSIPHTGDYTINPEGDIDWYRMYLYSGITYTTYTELINGSWLDPEFYFYGPHSADGSDVDPTVYIAWNDDGHGNWQPELEIEIIESGYYFLRVAYYGDDPGGKEGIRSTTGDYSLYIHEVIIDPPTLVSPSNGSQQNATEILFIWNASSGATEFEIEVADNPNFIGVFNYQNVGNNLSVQIGGFPNNGTTFYWHVRAGNGTYWSNYSSTFTFINGQVPIPNPPTLVSPSNGSQQNATEITFNWNAASSATEYYIQVAQDDIFSNLFQEQNVGNNTSVLISGFPNDETTFYWHVKAGNSAGWSDYSSTYHFINDPNAPTIINVPDDYPTIQAGIDAASDGYTVLVQPGTYYENINFNGKNIVVISTDGPDVTTIDGNQNGCVVIFENGEDNTAVFSGFTVMNGQGEGYPYYNGGGITCRNSSSPILSNIDIRENTSYDGGGILCDDSSPSLTNVTISENTASWGGGLLCRYSSPSLINVTIYGNSATQHGGGIRCYVSSISLENVTIYGNSADGHGGGIYVYSYTSNVNLLNCILWNDTPQEIYAIVSSVTATYSDIQGGWNGTGNIDADPLFADPDNGDFHLTAGSPCIDAGDPSSPPDPDGTIADMGALYFAQGWIGGHITLSGGGDNARPVTDVTIKAGDYSTNPDENGDYNLLVPGGTYDVRASLPAYSFGIENGIVVEAETTTTVDFTLHYTGIILVNQSEPGHYTTIQEAVDYALNHNIGKIYILPGTYDDGANIVVDDNTSLLISGTNKNQCIIEHSGSSDNSYAFKITDNSENTNIQISNLTVRNFDTGFRIIGGNFTGAPEISNNIIEYCECAIENYSGYPLIQNNIIQNNWGFATINNQQNHIRIINNQFISNFAYELATIFLYNFNWEYYDYNSIVKGNVFFQNESKYAPVFQYYTGNVEISNNNFIENICEERATAIEMKDVGGNCIINDNLFDGNIDQTYATYGVIYINQTTTANVDILNNTFINNSYSMAMISSGSNEVVDIKNCVFESNIIWNAWVISDPNANCDYSLFNNNTMYYGPSVYNGNCNFGAHIYSEIDPKLDDNYKPIWDTNNFSPCIDTGDPDEQYNDPDESRSDMGARPAIWHKYDKWQLPPNSVDDGWKWLSFPALDDLTNADDFDGDMAQYMLEDILDPEILDSVIWKPILIQNSDLEYIRYNVSYWTNLDHIFTSPQGYKFNMDDALQNYENLEVSGFLENKNTVIHLWGNLEDNWIGYFLEETQTIEDAFGSAMDNIYSIQMQHWEMKRKEMEPEAPWIIPKTQEEQTVQYGDMLIVQCFEEMDFQWYRNGNVPPHEETKTSYFTFTERADYVPIYVELDPEDIPDEIGVLVDGECKGASVVEDTLSQICAYILGSNGGELEFELYYDNKGTESNLNIEDYFVYNPETKLKEKRTIKVDDNKDYYLVSFKADESETIPEHFSIQNFPNPFNPDIIGTTIQYALPGETDVTITVYNLKGQKIKTLVNRAHTPGTYTAIWDGKNEAGRAISNGIYFYRVETDNKTLIKKMLLLR